MPSIRLSSCFPAQGPNLCPLVSHRYADWPQKSRLYCYGGLISPMLAQSGNLNSVICWPFQQYITASPFRELGGLLFQVAYKEDPSSYTATGSFRLPSVMHTSPKRLPTVRVQREPPVAISMRFSLFYSDELVQRRYLNTSFHVSSIPFIFIFNIFVKNVVS